MKRQEAIKFFEYQRNLNIMINRLKRIKKGLKLKLNLLYECCGKIELGSPNHIKAISDRLWFAKNNLGVSISILKDIKSQLKYFRKLG